MPRRQYRPVPWKRNVIKVPEDVTSLLTDQPATDFTIGTVKLFTRTDLAAGVLAHLGVQFEGGELISSGPICPPADMGRYSLKNREGWVVKRKDLPKENVWFESPNFGDWSKGSHLSPVPAYPRDYYDPPSFNLTVNPVGSLENEKLALKISVDFPYDQTNPAFPNDLLFGLNLLQENAGVCGIVPRDATTTELLGKLHMSWDFFPPGTREDEIVRQTLSGIRNVTPEVERRIRDRVRLFESLRPMRLLKGAGGLNRYIGAQFANDLVVFENMSYGNALYVLYEDWEQLSQRSRLELLRQSEKRYRRFVHTGNWQENFLAHIRAEKLRRGIIDNDGAAA